MQFTHQGFGPFLEWLTLVILATTPVFAAVLVYKLASLPGVIARSRRHPQAAAINICGWMGVVTGFLWPVAMVWAYLNPRERLAGRNDQASSVQARLMALSQRFSDVEARLRTGSGAQS